MPRPSPRLAPVTAILMLLKPRLQRPSRAARDALLEAGGFETPEPETNTSAPADAALNRVAIYSTVHLDLKVMKTSTSARCAMLRLWA